MMVISLAACDGQKKPEETKAPETAEETTEAAGETEETETEKVWTDTTPIKIGHICDLTGNEATTGEESSKALRFAVEKFGTICGRPVEIIEEDAKGDAATAADVARKLVEQDGVSAIFGPTQAGQKAAVTAYMDEAEVPLIFFNGTPTYLFQTSDWLIGAGGANPQMTAVIADYAYNELGYRKVHILTMDNTGFRSFSDDFTKFFTAHGGEIGQEFYVPFTSGDWSSYFAAMETEGVDGIMTWTTGAQAIALWKCYDEMGIDEKLPITAILSSAFTDYYIGNALKASGSGAIDSFVGTFAPSQYVYDIDTPENKAFVEEWKAEFGYVPNTNIAGLMYEAYQMFVAAVEANEGVTEPEQLREALMSVDITGPAGRLFFTDSNAATKDTYVVKVVEMEDGSYNYGIVKTYKDVPPMGK
jgi:branched-chain amino acid transport system substrate-binding protein